MLGEIFFYAFFFLFFFGTKKILMIISNTKEVKSTNQNVELFTDQDLAVELITDGP
jgi:hypothetical protein